MPASSRVRVRTIKPVGGTGTYGGSPQQWSGNGHRERCEDTIGDFGGNHPLWIRRDLTSGSRYVRTSGLLLIPEPGAPTRLYTHVPFVSNSIPLNTYVNRVLAATGPLTPNVNLPLALFELKDVPRMLRHAGNLLHGLKNPKGLDPAKEGAAATLAYQFGWKPLISDLKKLLDFSEAAGKQQTKIRKANTKHGHRSRVDLGSDSASWIDNTPVWSTFGSSLSPRSVHTINGKTWATIRWVVRDPLQYGKAPTFTEALKTSLGFNKGQIPIQLWKAMPWSWMIDWFTDISNVLQANYNSIYYKPYRLSIMRKTIASLTCDPIQNINGNPGNYLTAGAIHTVTCERYANNSPSSNVTLRLPFLDGFKMSILGSLAILKIKQ